MLAKYSKLPIDRIRVGQVGITASQLRAESSPRMTRMNADQFSAFIGVIRGDHSLKEHHAALLLK